MSYTIKSNETPQELEIEILKRVLGWFRNTLIISHRNKIEHEKFGDFVGQLLYLHHK